MTMASIIRRTRGRRRAWVERRDYLADRKADLTRALAAADVGLEAAKKRVAEYDERIAKMEAESAPCAACGYVGHATDNCGNWAAMANTTLAPRKA